MYPQFFGFDKLPFRLRPDSEFLYSGTEYLRARADLLGAVRGRARVTVFTGPPGVGKTLLLEDVLTEINGQFALCRINQPHISATELLQALLLQLGAPSVAADANRPQLFTELTASVDAARGRDAPPLLIIDDAQLLAAGTVATFREILARVPRLKILLVGRSDPQPHGEGLAARLGVTEKPREIQLPRLSTDGAKAYIEHRLAVAGGGGKELFTVDAYGMIFQHTGGAARLINVLCDAALHAACMRAAGHVSAAEILIATQDSRWPEALSRDKAGAAAAPGDGAVDHGPGFAGTGTLRSPTLSPVNGAAHPVEPTSTAGPAAAAPPSAAPADGTPARPLPVPPAAPAHTSATASFTTGSPAAATAPAVSAQLLVSHRREHITALRLEAGRISIGRASDNEVRLEAPFISRHHCRVVTEGNVSTIEDLGSVNGIAVNGKLVKRHVLKDADQVTLGEHVLTYVVS